MLIAVGEGRDGAGEVGGVGLARLELGPLALANSGGSTLLLGVGDGNCAAADQLMASDILKHGPGSPPYTGAEGARSRLKSTVQRLLKFARAPWHKALPGPGAS